MNKAIFCLVFLFAGIYAYAQHPSFEVTVTGKGQPVVLIPGYSCSADVWKETVEQLKSQYECHVINIAGFAGATPIDTPVLKTVKDELKKYIAFKKIKPYIIGHSLGAFMGLWVASEMKEDIKGLVCVDGLPAIAAMQNENIDYDSLAKSPAYNFETLVKNFKSLPDSGYVDGTAKAMLWQVSDTARAREIAWWSFKSDRKTLATTIREISLTDLRENLRKISCPVLVMASLYGTREMSEQVMQQQYRNLASKQIEVAQSKHFIMYDQPQWFYDKVKNFLASK